MHPQSPAQSHSQPRTQSTMMSEAHTERRGHVRFDMAATGTGLGLVRSAANRMDLERFTLANLSQGGMCIKGSDRLDKGAIEHFVMDLTVPSPSMVLVRAEVRWVGSQASGDYAMGIRFIESSKAWLGPSDSGYEDF